MGVQKTEHGGFIVPASDRPNSDTEAWFATRSAAEEHLKEIQSSSRESSGGGTQPPSVPIDPCEVTRSDAEQARDAHADGNLSLQKTQEYIAAFNTECQPSNGGTDDGGGGGGDGGGEGGTDPGVQPPNVPVDPCEVTEAVAQRARDAHGDGNLSLHKAQEYIAAFNNECREKINVENVEAQKIGENSIKVDYNVVSDATVNANPVISMTLNGSEVDSRTVSLEGGEIKNVSATLEDFPFGTNEICVNMV